MLLASAADLLLEVAARRSLLAQVKLLAAPTAEVEAAVPLLLPLLEDDAADVRRLAIALAEEAGRAQPAMIPELLPALLARLSDESAPTLKRAVAAATALLRPTLALLLGVADEAAAAALGPTWQGLCQLRTLVGTLLTSSSAADSVRTAAAKACEAIVLAYTVDAESAVAEPLATPAGDAAAAGGAWRLSALPAPTAGDGDGDGDGADGSTAATAAAAHALLDRATLEGEGEATLGLLEATLLAPPSATILLVLLTSCASLAKQRPALLPRLANSLSELQRRLLSRAPSLAALPTHQLANAQQSLRASLLTVLKLPQARLPNRRLHRLVPWHARRQTTTRPQRARLCTHHIGRRAASAPSVRG